MADVAEHHATPPAGRRQAQVEETRERIVDAALTTFGRLGVDSSRVEDICQSAAVSRATFYRHFASKEDVFLALLERLRVHLEGVAARVEPVDITEAGYATLRDLIAEVHLISERWAPIVESLSQPQAPTTPARQAAVQLIVMASRTIGRAFAAGAAGGDDPPMAALAVTALVEGFEHQIRTWHIGFDREEVIDSLTYLCMRMLHPDRPAPSR